MVRLLIFAAAALSGGVAMGRKALDREVEKRVSAAVELAQAKAVAELDVRIRVLVRERVVALAINLAIKAAMIAGAYALYANEELTATGFRIMTSVLLTAFLARDVLITAPFVTPALRYARQAGWSPRRAIKTFVVGVIFERAYAEALTVTERGPHRFWIGLSTYGKHSISTDVAQKVAEVAVDTSFTRARTLMLVSAATITIMFAAYSAFATLAFVSV